MSIAALKLRFMRLVVFFIVSQIKSEFEDKNKKEEDEKHILQESFKLINGLNDEIECVEREEKL